MINDYLTFCLLKKNKKKEGKKKSERKMIEMYNFISDYYWGKKHFLLMNHYSLAI